MVPGGGLFDHGMQESRTRENGGIKNALSIGVPKHSLGADASGLALRGLTQLTMIGRATRLSRQVKICSYFRTQWSVANTGMACERRSSSSNAILNEVKKLIA